MTLVLQIRKGSDARFSLETSRPGGGGPKAYSVTRFMTPFELVTAARIELDRWEAEQKGLQPMGEVRT